MADFKREEIEAAWRHRMELQDADDWQAFGMTFTEDADVLLPASSALADLVKQRRVEKLVVERIDGVSAHESSVSNILTDAGFSATPRGLRLRSM